MNKTRALISTQALAHNLQLARQHAPGCKLLAVIKADAYGHGAVALLPVLDKLADGLAVARLEEARPLRMAGYEGSLVLLAGVIDEEELTQALRLKLDLVIHDPAQLTLLSRYQAPAGLQARLWLKLDTGMHRLGFASTEFASALACLRQLPWCQSVTAMTHFASADEPDNSKTRQQIEQFRQTLNQLPIDDDSLANSAGLLAWPDARTGWTRPGLMLYGVNPLDKKTHPLDLKPVMQLQARVIAVRELHPGETVGYNETWRASRPSRIAYVAAGYADGYPVTLSDTAYVGHLDQRLPVVGRVSMDTIAVDCTEANILPATGDWLELWGKTIAVKEIARAAGTIPYQLLTSVSTRVPRELLQD